MNTQLEQAYIEDRVTDFKSIIQKFHQRNRHKQAILNSDLARLSDYMPPVPVYRETVKSKRFSIRRIISTILP